MQHVVGNHQQVLAANVLQRRLDQKFSFIPAESPPAPLTTPATFGS